MIDIDEYSICFMCDIGLVLLLYCPKIMEILICLDCLDLIVLAFRVERKDDDREQESV